MAGKASWLARTPSQPNKTEVAGPVSIDHVGPTWTNKKAGPKPSGDTTAPIEPMAYLISL